MRLTLRTLLAYLDDVLDASRTREIGQKLRESRSAAELVSRIREVMRSRRLGAYDLHEGLDPNLIAEYLDNQLKADDVVSVERVCLHSDLQLAEVAACHQILSLVLSEPVEVPRESLQRFYALGAQPAVLLEVERAGKAGQEPPPADSPRSDERREPPAVPEYLHPEPWSQRLTPYLGVAAVLVIAGLLLLMDRDLFREMRRSARQGGTTPTVSVTDSGKGPTVPPGGAARPPSPARNGEEQPASSTPPSTVPDEGESAFSLPASQPLVPPSPPLPTVPERVAPTTADNAPRSSTPSSEPPQPLLTVPLKVVQAQGVLLKKDVSTNLWRVWNRAGEMVTGDELACPEPFEATLEDAAKELRITLLGDTRLEWLAPAGEARVQMQLDRGRVVFVWQAGNDQSPVVIRIGKSAFRLEPQEAGGTCGVEVIGRGPVGFERQPPPPGVLAVLHVAAARIRVVPDQGEPVTVSSGARWPLIGPLTEDELVSPSGAWLDPSQRTTVFPLRRFASRFEKLFDPQISAEQALAPLYRDPHPILAELATRGLALLDQTDDLVQALAESSHVEVRRAAVHGLRQWLARTTDGGQSVLAALLRRYPTEQDARLVYRLLWGLSLTDGQDSMLSQGLVELLTDNRVEIRELAFEQMVKLTGRRYDYQPLASPSSRLAGQQRWRQHLEREGGALVRPR